MTKKYILVLYFRYIPGKLRNTIKEHLYSFRNYSKDSYFHYFNAANGIPWYLKLIPYDGVILHYTFLAVRWNNDFYFPWLKTLANLKKINGYKVAIPQDEYAETNLLKKFFLKFNIKTVFTCFPEKDFNFVYPIKDTGLKHRISVFPGYIDENALKKYKKKDFKYLKRDVDLGYRAREVPFWLGRHGQKKAGIGKAFKAIAEINKDISVDISMDPSDVFLGTDWYKYLFRCRNMLGCEGGASMLDADGEIRRKTETYLSKYPEALFDEIEKNCFTNTDNNIHLFSLSPRHFECAITKTCQVLLEGNYGGIFKPGIHYIQVKEDYSNIDNVMKMIKNKSYCNKIAENAYRDIVKSGKYTYKAFSQLVIDNIIMNINKTSSKERNGFLFLLISIYLYLLEKIEWILVPILFPFILFKIHKRKALNKIIRYLFN